MILNKTNARGMTLTEVIVVMTLATTVIAAACGFCIQILAGQVVVRQRLDQAMDVRRFSQELIHNASRANQVLLYKSQKTPTDWDTPSDQLDISGGLHPAGDFVVFVYYEFPQLSANGNYHRIKKIIGYYLDTVGGQIGAIKRVTIDLSKNLSTGAATPADQVAAYYFDPVPPNTNSKAMIEQVMVDNWASAIHTRFDVFALQARGLFKSEVVAEGFGRLFYLRDSQLSMMVAGQLFTVNASPILKKSKYTDSFNFSITPRS
jgi:type II secretory pathway pseudopilin PulG